MKPQGTVLCPQEVLNKLFPLLAQVDLSPLSAYCIWVVQSEACCFLIVPWLFSQFISNILENEDTFHTYYKSSPLSTMLGTKRPKLSHVLIQLIPIVPYE